MSTKDTIIRTLGRRIEDLESEIEYAVQECRKSQAACNALKDREAPLLAENKSLAEKLESLRQKAESFDAMHASKVATEAENKRLATELANEQAKRIEAEQYADKMQKERDDFREHFIAEQNKRIAAELVAAPMTPERAREVIEGSERLKFNSCGGIYHKDSGFIWRDGTEVYCNHLSRCTPLEIDAVFCLARAKCGGKTEGT